MHELDKDLSANWVWLQGRNCLMSNISLMSYSWDRIFNLVSLDNGAKMSPKRRAFLSLVFGISSSFGKTKNKCYQQLKHLQPLLWVGEDFLQGCICNLVECCIYCQLSSQIIWSTEDCTIFIYMRRMLKLFSMLSKIVIKPNWTKLFYQTSWKVESQLRKVWISDVSSVSPSSERIRNPPWRAAGFFCRSQVTGRRSQVTGHRSHIHCPNIITKCAEQRRKILPTFFLAGISGTWQ